MEQLKFITCGSVDDGKSTLIGHMLYDAKLIFADQKNALELDSKVNKQGLIDYSLLLDGLEDERKQGITIDVAYRFFKTEKRSFIVADCPGHEEYTHNMAVGANFADLALILIDASKGLLIQTKRHLRICNMMGIRDFVFAINKMDLVNYNEKVFNDITSEILALIKEIEKESNITINTFISIPVSAVVGDNLTKLSTNTKWYKGLPLLQYLENVETYKTETNDCNYILPVQRVARANKERYYQGTLNKGKVSTNDEVIVLPSLNKAKIKTIIKDLDKIENAIRGEAISLCLDKELDISRGNVLVKENNLFVGNRFVSRILVLNKKELTANSHYRFELNCQGCEAVIKKILYRIDINTGKTEETDVLKENEIGVVEFELSNNIVFDKFINNKELGEFILIDYLNHSTSVYGTIIYPLEVEGRVVKQDLSITRSIREKRNGRKAYTLFFTGLSCSGKSTLADAVEKELFNKGINTMILDGDNMRMGLCSDLGFSEDDREENIRRVAEVARLLNDAGVTVLCSFVSPFKKVRETAKTIISDSYIEIYVEASIETCRKRDKKGNYEKALRGEIKNFTGISSPFEKPENPNIVVNTEENSVEDCVKYIIDKIERLK